MSAPGGARASRRAAPIALVTIEYPPTVGGVATATRRLTRTLVGGGFDVHVVVPMWGGRQGASRRREDGATIHRFGMDLTLGLQRANLAMLQQIKGLDRELGFGLFHSFFLVTAFPCAVLAGQSRPVLVSIRGGDMVAEHHPAIREAALFSLRRADWVTSVNQENLDVLAGLIDLEGRCSVIRNGVEPVDPSFHWNPRTRRRGEIGVVGQFHRTKDIPLLVRAFAAVRPELRRRLHLLGPFTDPDEERWSRQLAAELGVEEQVRFLGKRAREEIPGLVSSFHVYAQSSADEGLPNALLEAAACGVPLVATAVGGMKEILRHGENALVVPHGDPQTLTAALERVLSDDALAIELSRGSHHLAARLSAEREHDAWLELYRRLFENDRRGREPRRAPPRQPERPASAERRSSNSR